jgi:ubiquinone/menaquinone biosynthesis C-methylase UbiE/DNA-binding transcriptional regulator YhcF (GntR family)
MSALDLFKALADPVRLRTLRMLGRAELSVAELVDALGIPQSTVSRHLRPLRQAELVDTRRDGTSVFYRRGKIFADPEFARMLERQLTGVSGEAQDAAAVHKVLDERRRRSREFFDQVAGEYGRFTDPGGGWEAAAQALASGYIGRRVVDVGCGEGALTMMLGRFAREVVAVDLSPEMLRVIEEKARQEGLADIVRTVEGDMEEMPLPSGFADAVFLSQALHHASRPERAVAECARILRAGGLLIVLDLVRHQQEWVRDQWADLWMGFEVEEIDRWLSERGMERVVIRRLDGAAPELGVLMAVGRKAADGVGN